MKASRFSAGVVVGLPRSGRAPLRTLISIRCGPGDASAALIESLISSMDSIRHAVRYPQARAIAGRSVFIATVSCPPTESCAPLLSTKWMNLSGFLLPIMAVPPRCIRKAPSPSMHAVSVREGDAEGDL